MKNYSKPMMNVISVMSNADISATFAGFEGFGDFSSSNIESYLANSDNLGNFKK